MGTRRLSPAASLCLSGRPRDWLCCNPLRRRQEGHASRRLHDTAEGCRSLLAHLRRANALHVAAYERWRRHSRQRCSPRVGHPRVHRCTTGFCAFTFCCRARWGPGLDRSHAFPMSLLQSRMKCPSAGRRVLGIFLGGKADRTLVEFLGEKAGRLKVAAAQSQ